MHKKTTQKLRRWALRSSFLALPVAYVLFSSNSGGISGQSVAGCSCHGPNNATATMLAITGMPSSGWTPGQSYSVTATVINTVRAAGGFNLSVTAGTISNAGAGTTLVSTNEIRHSAPKSMLSGSVSWTFTWTAPASGSSVDFHFAGNAVNRDGGTGGDLPNQTTITYNAAASGPAFGPTFSTTITTSTATVNGSITPNGSATFGLKYGPTSAMTMTAVPNPTGGVGNTPLAVSANLSSLLPNTKYYYAFTATVNAVTTSSAMDSFTTMPMSVSNVAPERTVVYPNPATTTLEWALPAGVKVQNAFAFTLNGQRTALTFAQGGTTTKADVSTLAPGIYYLLLDGGNKNYMASFQKN